MLKHALTATPETIEEKTDAEMIDFAATESDFDAEWLKSANVIRADKDSDGLDGSEKNDLEPIPIT